MTTKGPLYKQVIILIDSNNMVKFMSNSSNHVINIDRLLKNIKSEYKTDYIRAEKSGIIIVTDKVILPYVLAMKADTDELHTIFLLKKNARQDIVKTILGYPPMAMPETLKEWKVAITSVGQGYESTEGQHNYKISTGTTYRE